MGKAVLASASCYTRLYYYNPEFKDIPKGIQDEIKYICVPLAEKLHGIFTIGFYEDGEVYLEISSDEADYVFDEIGSKLEIKRLEKEKSEFFDSLKYWYVVYKTPQGQKLKKSFTKE